MNQTTNCNAIASDTVTLWSWQRPEFSLTSGSVDWSASEYYRETPGVPEAYKRLAGVVGTKQLIWCYTKPDEFLISKTGCRVEWQITLPRSHVLRFIDDLVWNAILGIRCGLSRKRRHACKEEALRREPHDAVARRQLESLLEDSYYPEGTSAELWNKLFVADETGEQVSALIGHPAREKHARLTGRREGGERRSVRASYS